MVAVEAFYLELRHHLPPSEPAAVQGLLRSLGHGLAAKPEVHIALQHRRARQPGSQSNHDQQRAVRAWLLRSTCVCSTVPNLLHSSLTSDPISSGQSGSDSLQRVACQSCMQPGKLKQHRWRTLPG